MTVMRSRGGTWISNCRFFQGGFSGTVVPFDVGSPSALRWSGQKPLRPTLQSFSALFRPPLINRLECLHLAENSISADEFSAAVGQASGPCRLRRLGFCDRSAFRPELDFFKAPLLRNLVDLNLSGMELGPDGFA